MKKIIIGISATALLVAAATPVVLPLVVDWSRYRDDIAARIGEMTGRSLSIGGEVGLRLLPGPAFTVENVRISAPPGFTAPDMAVLKRLEARVALLPLLSGRVQVENIVVVAPRVVVETDARGRVNWAAGAGASGGAAAQRPASPLAQVMSFDQIAVENGRLDIIDGRSGGRETLDDIDLRVVAGSLTGPFQISGGVALRGAPLRLDATTGRFGDGAAAPVRLAVTLPGGDPERLSGARFAGIIGGAGAGPRVQGDIRLEGPDLRGAVQPLRAGGGAALPEALARPFSLRATVEVGDDRIRFDNLEAGLGETRGSGVVAATWGEIPDIAVSLLFNRLDMDIWAPPSRGAAALDSMGNGAKNRRAAITARPAPAGPGAAAPATAAGPGADGGFKLPANVRLKLDLTVDAAHYAGGVVRQGRLGALLADGAVEISQLSAQLPGGAALAAEGRVGVTAGAPQADMRFNLDADHLRGLLEWLRLDVGMIPADRLRKTALVGRVMARPDRLELADIDMTLDASRLRGALAAEWRERPALGLRLELDSLNLDSYWPVSPTVPVSPAAPLSPPASPAAVAGTAPGRRAAAPAPVDVGRALDAAEEAVAGLMGLADVTVQATADRLIIGGQPLAGVRLDATAAGGALELRDVSATDAAGLALRLSGQAAGVAPLNNAHLMLNAETADLPATARALGWGDVLPPGTPSGPAGLQARLAGDRGRLALEGTLTAAGATLTAGGEAVKPLALLGLTAGNGGRVDVAARLSHPDADALLGLAGWRAPAAAGPFDVYARLTGDGPRLSLSDISGQIGAAPVAGGVKLDRKPTRPLLEADLQTGVLDFDRLTDRLTDGLTDGVLTHSPLTGAPQPAPGGGVTGAEVGDRVGGLAALRLFDGRFALTAAGLRLAGVALDDTAARLRLNDGALALDRFDARLAGGRIGGRGELTVPPPSANGSAASGGRRPRLTLSLTAEGLKPAADAVAGPLSLGGGVVDAEADIAITDPQLADWRRRLSGTARVSARGGALQGVDMAALRDRLQKIDRPQAVTEGVLRGLQSGRTVFTALDASCQIDGGVLNTTDARLESAAGGAGAVGRVDLAERTIDMLVTVEPDVDPPFPPLALRLTGGLDAPTRSLDIGAVQRQLQERLTGR